MSEQATPQFLSRSQFALFKGWGKSYITKLGKQGKLVLDDEGKLVNVPATLARLNEAMDPSKAHVADRHDEARKERDVAQHVRFDAPSDDGNQGKSGKAESESGYWVSKSRREAALATLAEVELLERSGSFVRRDLVEANIEAVYRMLRDSMMGMPTQISPELATMTNAFDIEKRLQAEIRRRLEDLTKITAQDLRDLNKSAH